MKTEWEVSAERLVRRLVALEAALLDDAAPDEGHEQTLRRQEIGNFLAAEYGRDADAMATAVAPGLLELLDRLDLSILAADEIPAIIEATTNYLHEQFGEESP